MFVVIVLRAGVGGFLFVVVFAVAVSLVERLLVLMINN